MEQPLSYYKIFYTAAREKNISRAAKLLYISQPAVSKAISNLEKSLGVTLFHRSSKGVRLTEEGEFLYSHVQTAFQALEGAEEHLHRINQLEIGHLHLGTSNTLCKYVLLPYLKEFVELHPNIHVSISCQSSDQTIELLKNGAIDIGLVGAPDTPGPLRFESLMEIQDIFVASVSYLENLNHRAPDNVHFPFHDATIMLLDEENMSRKHIDTYLTEHHIHPHNMIEVTSMDLLIDFAKISLGIACVIENFVESELKNQELKEIPLRVPIPKRQVGFACLDSTAKSNAAKEFIQFVKNTLTN